MKNSSLSDIETRCLSGVGATVDEALALDAACSTDELCDAADRVRIALHGNRVDTCSIANARSGSAPKTANGVPSRAISPPA